MLEQRLARFRVELNLRVVANLRLVRKVVVTASIDNMNHREHIIQFNNKHSARIEELDQTTKKLVDAIINQRDVFKAVQDKQLLLLRTQNDDTHTILKKQYLEKLPVATQACLNYYERRHDFDYLPNTRVELL